MLAYLVLAVIGIVFLFWPEFGRHMFVWRRPRAAFVRLAGLSILLLLVWLVFVHGST
jgi:hypothetical protein